MDETRRMAAALPDDPAERRKIGIRLVILAALGLIAQIISCMLGEQRQAGLRMPRFELWMFGQINLVGRRRERCPSEDEDSNVMPFDLASALPFALALRIGIAAVTVLAAPRRGVALRLAFLGSVAASLATGVAAVHVLEWRRGGERRAVRTPCLRVLARVFD